MSVDQGLSALVKIIIPTSGATRNLLFVGAVEKRPLASAQERCLPACEERARARGRAMVARRGRAALQRRVSDDSTIGL